MEFPKIDEVYKLLSEKLESWVEGGITLLPNIVVAFFYCNSLWHYRQSDRQRCWQDYAQNV